MRRARTSANSTPSGPRLSPATKKSRTRTSLSFALLVSVLMGCAPTFATGGKSQEEFDRDHAECLAQSSTKTAARYGPSHHTDWKNYTLCMSSKGYPRQ